jgi:aminopeptidase N
VLGQRLQSSLQPAGWRAITYGKGSWILQMLRRRMGDQRFYAMLGDIAKRYDHASITTDQFRQAAAQLLPPKSEDPTLEGFFDQWVYGTGIPTLKFSYALKGQAPALKLVGTLTQTGVDDDFSAYTPVEIQLARGQTITHWVACSNEPVTFTVALKQTPLKVTLDPHNAVLRR